MSNGVPASPPGAPRPPPRTANKQLDIRALSPQVRYTHLLYCTVLKYTDITSFVHMYCNCDIYIVLNTCTEMYFTVLNTSNVLYCTVQVYRTGFKQNIQACLRIDFTPQNCDGGF